MVSEIDMETMQELHNLAVSLAQEQGKKYSLLAVLDFLDHGFTSMGGRFEAVATGGLQGGTDRTIEAKRLLENLLLGCIQSIKSTLGTAWTRDKEQGQGQGQAAYESKSEPVPDECATSLDELARIFNVLTSCVRTCPTVLINLPASVGAENDRLCNRAVESAVTTLTDCDVDSSLAAIQFLLALVSGKASPFCSHPLIVIMFLAGHLGEERFYGTTIRFDHRQSSCSIPTANSISTPNGGMWLSPPNYVGPRFVFAVWSLAVVAIRRGRDVLLGGSSE